MTQVKWMRKALVIHWMLNYSETPSPCCRLWNRQLVHQWRSLSLDRSLEIRGLVPIGLVLESSSQFGFLSFVLLVNVGSSCRSDPTKYSRQNLIFSKGHIKLTFPSLAGKISTSMSEQGGTQSRVHVMSFRIRYRQLLKWFKGTVTWGW